MDDSTASVTDRDGGYGHSVKAMLAFVIFDEYESAISIREQRIVTHFMSFWMSDFAQQDTKFTQPGFSDKDRLLNAQPRSKVLVSGVID